MMFETLTIHAGQEPDPANGVVMTPFIRHPLTHKIDALNVITARPCNRLGCLYRRGAIILREQRPMSHRHPAWNLAGNPSMFATSGHKLLALINLDNRSGLA